MTTMPSAGATGRRLSRREVIGYGLPRFGTAIMFLTIIVYLPKYYTDVLLLKASLISWTFLIGRFWDAATDPLMGYISDRTESGMGRRRPYFIISAIPWGIAYFLLWSPPAGLQHWGLFVYVTSVYLLTYTFSTIFSIPYNSLGAELTTDYHERTVLTSTRESLGVLGTIVGAIGPPLCIGFLGSKQRGYSFAAGVTGVITAALIFIMFFSVREDIDVRKKRQVAIKEGVKALFKNQAFRALLLVFVIALMGNSLVPILTLYMADYVVKAPKVASFVILSYLMMATVSIILWSRLSRRIGKREAWSYGLMFSSAVFAVSTYYHEGTWLIWIILAGLAGFGYGCTLALAYSMLADVIDLDELETGARREGVFFGIWFFVEKGAVGLVAFMGLQLLALMGYVPNVEQSLRVIWSMKFLYSIFPAICFAACCFLLRSYPITQKEHERIRAAIEERKLLVTADSDG
ncbi:MAG: MFS transporter [Candidatus Lindowbacteria bacterium]|nr:MFS transporter [Candidatus Lindowbacteria bacterium]